MWNRHCFLSKVSLFIIFLQPLTSFGQVERFTATPVTAEKSNELAAHLQDFTVYTFDMPSLSAYAQSPEYRNAVELEFPGYPLLDLDLVHQPMQSATYVRSIQTENGLITEPFDGVIKTFVGNQRGGGYEVRLTIDTHFLDGLVQVKNDILYVEPLWYFIPDAPRTQVVVYYESDIVEGDEQHQCELVHPPGYQKSKSVDPVVPRAENRSVACKEIEIAYADDWLMYQDYNQSVTDVENHNLAVMNNTQTNYDDEFNDEYQFVIVETWIATCSSCDPWTTSTAAGQLLSSFSNWAGGGFSNGHDVGVLWTDRNFDGPTIGIAWTDAVCFPNFKYATCQDFTSNAGSLRTLLSHELGHSCGSDHVPGNSTIMAEFLNVTDDWHPNAINWINNYLGGVGCLAGCVTGQPPVANFDSDAQEGCAPFVVQFEDLSTGTPTSWDWTFPGGTPSSSTQPNPEVTYNSAGVFDVVLEVSNGLGTDSYVIADFITVEEQATADFTSVQNQLTVDFINLSTSADSYLWEFGDGAISVATDPTHTYAQDGLYEVILTAFNSVCGNSTYNIFLDIVSQPFAAFTYEPNIGCEPLVVSFINQSTANVDDFFWEFPGGSPATSTEENPVVIYDNPGEYSATLTVQNEAGDNALTLIDIVVVEPVPSADFDAVTGGLDVQFVNNSSDASGYVWLFGDGNSSTQVSPAHTYQMGGTYEVLLIAANNCGSDTAFFTLALNSVPAASFSPSAAVGCSPFEVTYTSTSTGDVDAYFWEFPGGTPATSNAQSPVVSYPVPGTYAAQLIVSNAIGSDTFDMDPAVVVQPQAISDFSFVVNGNSADFQNLSIGATDYIWLIDNQVFVSTNPTYNFPADGDYLVSLIAEGPCGPDTSEAVIHIATLPSAGFSASGATTGCEPFFVQFMNQSSANVTSLLWEFPGGTPATSTDANPVVQYLEPGVYPVSLTVMAEAGSDQITMTDLVIVNPLPEANFQTVQTGLEVVFENLSEDADFYAWSFDDGSFSDQADPTHTFPGFGEYNVMLIASNDCGSDTMVIQLSLAAIPVPLFAAGQPQGCVPFTVQFEDQSQNGVQSWEWTFAGGTPATSTLQNPEIIYLLPGVYDVTLRVTNTAGSQALVREDYIVVGEPPVSGFDADVQGNVVVLTNTSVGAGAFLWSFGDGQIDTSSNPVHSYANSGDYVIQLIALNNCGADTSEIVVNVVTTSTSEEKEHLDVNIYPNPNSGTFTVAIGDVGEPVAITLLDVLGRIIMERPYVATVGETGIQVRLDNIPPGVYYLIAESQTQESLLRVMIQ